MKPLRAGTAAVTAVVAMLLVGSWPLAVHGQAPCPPDADAPTASPTAPPRCAVSPDGQWRLVADAEAPRLRLYDGHGALRREWPVASLDGRTPSRVAAVRHSGAGRSFVVALRDLPELWEIALDPAAEPVYNGLVHDYRMGEGLASPGHLGVRRTPLAAPLADLRVAPGGRWLVGVQVARAGAPTRQAGETVLHLVHLDVRRAIAQWPLADGLGLERVAFATACGRPLLGLPGAAGQPPRWLSLVPGSAGAPASAPGSACQPPV